MLRDIDHVIEGVKSAIPGVRVAQLHVSHPGVDDDGLWFIEMDEMVQIESSNCACPFLIESDFSGKSFQGHSTEEVVSAVKQPVCRITDLENSMHRIPAGALVAASLRNDRAPSAKSATSRRELISRS
jgi:hypothetical protein